MSQLDGDKPKAQRYKPAGLSEQELKFCLEYVREKNGTRAVILAGYTSDYHTASVTSCRLLRKVSIKRYLDQLLEDLQVKYTLDIQSILTEWAIIGQADIEHVELNRDGTLEVKPGIHPAARRAVRKKVVNSTQTTDTLPDGTTRRRRKVRGTVELHDKHKALQCLYRHFRDMEKENKESKPDDSARAAVGLDLLVQLGAILQAGGTPSPPDGPAGPADGRTAVPGGGPPQEQSAVDARPRPAE